MQLAKYFIDNPILCGIVATLFTIFWFVIREVQIRHHVGDPHPLYRLMILWWLNTIWEWGRFLKPYALKWDVRVTYPVIFLITTLLLMRWLVYHLASLQSKSGSTEKELVKDMRSATIFFITLLAPTSLAKLIQENKYYLLVLPFFLAIVLGFYSLVAHGTFEELVRYFGIGILFGSVLEAAAWALIHVQSKESKKGSLKGQVLKEAEKLEQRTELLRGKISEFERLAVVKFHAITPESNAEYASTKRLLERFEARLDGVAKLITQDHELAYDAAMKLLNTEIDIRDNFVDKLIREEQKTHLDKSEWDKTLDSITKQFESVIAQYR